MAHKLPKDSDEKIQPCKTLSELAAVLAGQVRLEIVALLAQGSRDVTSITAMLSLDLSHVSTNLRILRKRGLIEFKQDRRRRIYYLSKAISCRTHEGLLHLEIVCSNGDLLSCQMKLSNDQLLEVKLLAQQDQLQDDPRVDVCEAAQDC